MYYYDSYQSAGIWLLYLFISIMLGLPAFVGIPLFALWIGRPLSRRRLFFNMLVYTAAVAALCLLFWFSALETADSSLFEILTEFERSDILIFAIISLLPFCLSPVSYFIMCGTNKVDVHLPAGYRLLRPVKAVITEIDGTAAAEYNGRRYEFRKPLKFSLRDRVKVLIKEDSDECYLS